MFEAWRRWNHKRYEARVSVTEDYAQFEQLVSGPWTTEMVSRMPWDILVKGPQFGNIDTQTRKLIDLEIEKRIQSRQPFIANVISFGALLIAVIALYKSW